MLLRRNDAGSGLNRTIRHWLLCGAAVSVLGTAALAAWLLSGALAARSDLEQARAAVGRLQSDLLTGDTEQAERHLALAGRRASAARRTTSGPAWDVAAKLPLAGRPVRTARGLAEAADDLTHTALPELVRVGGGVRPAAVLATGGRIDVARLATAAAPLADAEHDLARIRADLAALPADSGVDRLDAARAALVKQVTHARAGVAGAAKAARILPPMLGADRPRSYFLAIQTNAEARGTGGLVGAFAIVTADRGRITFQKLASNTEIPRAATPVVDLGPEFAQRYAAAESAQLLANSNMSPHYPYAARIWTGLWQRQTGQRLDGAVATDPVALAAVLGVIGPVTLPGGERLTAANAVSLTEQGVYARFQDQVARKAYLIRVAAAVVDALMKRDSDADRLVRTLAGTSSEGRFKVWSAHPDEQAVLAGTAVGGVLPGVPGPYVQLVVNNAAGGKLDYYLDRSVEYRLGPCGPEGRASRVRILLTNRAPARGLPDYVAGRPDEPGYRVVRGSNKLLVSVYASVGAEFTEARLDGKPTLMVPEVERRHSVFSTDVELPPGRTRVLELDLVEPSVGAPATTAVQPLVRSQRTDVSDQPCRRPAAASP
jgi:hypothetical protein